MGVREDSADGHLGGEDRFTQGVRAFVSSTPSFSVYSVYSAV